MKKNRVGLIVFFFAVFLVVLIVRVVFVTVLPDPRLKQYSDELPPRGKILGIHGEELAVPSYSYSFYARTTLLTPQVKNFLKTTLLKTSFMNQDDLSQFDTSKGFIWIKRRLNIRQKEYLDELIQSLIKEKYISQDELGLLKEESRYYAYPFLSGIIGIVGIDAKGLMGLEYQYNEKLRQGFHLMTTIDPEIARIAYEELRKAIKTYQAEKGSVVIFDPRNGRIVAMVGYPDYDPNVLSTLNTNNIKPVFNSYIYEPGSVMKQFAAAFALENNYASPHYPQYWCGGELELGDAMVRDGTAHGMVDMSQIIQKSCNVGISQIAKNFDRPAYSRFLTSLGFGIKPDLPLTDLEKGILRPESQWSFLSKYMLSMGQEIGVTSLQLAHGISILGAYGSDHALFLSRGWIDPEGKMILSTNQPGHQKISHKTCEEILQIMKTVVSEQGTAIKAKVEGITIAGKTGTGQVARKGGGGYYPDLFNAVFTGYVPADQPQLVMVVAIHKPHSHEHTGGKVAAPVFADIVRRMIISTSYFQENQN